MDRIQFRDLYLLLSKVFGKLQERGLLRPLDPQTIPNLLPKGVRHQSKVCLLLGPQLLYRSLLFSQACHLKIWLKKKLLWNYATTQSWRINCLFEEESSSKKPKKNQGSQFRTVPAGMVDIYRTGQCTGTSTPLVSYRKKYRPYRQNPAVSAGKDVLDQYKQEEKRKRKGRRRWEKVRKGEKEVEQVKAEAVREK